MLVLSRQIRMHVNARTPTVCTAYEQSNVRCTEIEIGHEKRKRTSQRSHDKAEAGNASPFTRFVLLCEKNRLLVKFIEQSVGGSENRDSSSLPFHLPQDSNDVYVYDTYLYVVACVESRDSIHWPIVHFLFSTPLCFFHFVLFCTRIVSICRTFQNACFPPFFFVNL